jgi:hypothetical protein
VEAGVAGAHGTLPQTVPNTIQREVCFIKQPKKETNLALNLIVWGLTSTQTETQGADGDQRRATVQWRIACGSAKQLHTIQREVCFIKRPNLETNLAQNLVFPTGTRFSQEGTVPGWGLVQPGHGVRLVRNPRRWVCLT